MPQGATLQVEGYQELLRAFAFADKASQKALRDTLRQVGETVRLEATQRLSAKDARSAAGFRTVVRQRGIEVDQRLRKTTRLHPEWGSYQMRHALVPALYANEDNTVRRMEHAMDTICQRFNHTGMLA